MWEGKERTDGLKVMYQAWYIMSTDFIVRKVAGKVHLEDKRWSKYDIKIEFKQTRYGYLGWIRMAQEKDHKCVYANTVMDLIVSVP